MKNLFVKMLMKLTPGVVAVVANRISQNVSFFMDACLMGPVALARPPRGFRF